MRIESTFTPLKLCLDYKTDKDLLIFLCTQYLNNAHRKWYDLGSPNQWEQETFNKVKNLYELLK